MKLVLPLASVLQPATSSAAPSVQVEEAIPITSVKSNRTIVETAFADWQAGRRSFYDLVTNDGSAMIAGQSPHSGTFGKAEFLRCRTKPFQARFSTPIIPTRWNIWAMDDEVFVRWDSEATACDGKPYVNSYAYFIAMQDGRATGLTMFLDMGAFDDVWSRCQPADCSAESEQ